MRDRHLKIGGFEAGVRLLDCEALEACLPTVLAGLPFEVLPVDGQRSFASVIHANGRYRVHAPAIGEPTYQRDAVNAACELVGLVARLMALDADRLVLHAAAVAANGALIVFPAGRRAGKSLLTVAAGQLGAGVFGDDVLPVSLVPGEPMLGVAFGASPRLRLPLPAVAADLAARLAGTPSVTNDQYRYVALPELVQAGERLPVGAFVTLRLEEGARPRIDPASRGALLRTLLKQNFGRGGRADVLLSGLHALASSAPAYVLTYSDPTEAASLLMAELVPQMRSVAPLLEPQPETSSAVLSEQVPPGGVVTYRRRDGARMLELEGERFAASPDGRKIHHINEGLFQIWSLLEDPATPIEIAGDLRSVFGNLSAQKIDGDVAAAFAGLAEAGLIVPVEQGDDPAAAVAGGARA